MPEAIVLEKILQHDERTSCMKPDIRITLDVEAIKTKGKSKSHSGNLQLRKVFRSRLLDFFKSHPEVQLVLHTPFFLVLIVLLSYRGIDLFNLLCDICLIGQMLVWRTLMLLLNHGFFWVMLNV